MSLKRLRASEVSNLGIQVLAEQLRQCRSPYTVIVAL